MRINHVVGALVTVLSCALTTSCLQSPTAASEGDAADLSPATCAEPIGENEQAAYEDTFHFVVVVKDDGQEESGGWQAATTTLNFVPRMITISSLISSN